MFSTSSEQFVTLQLKFGSLQGKDLKKNDEQNQSCL